MYVQVTLHVQVAGSLSTSRVSPLSVFADRLLWIPLCSRDPFPPRSRAFCEREGNGISYFGWVRDTWLTLEYEGIVNTVLKYRSRSLIETQSFWKKINTNCTFSKQHHYYLVGSIYRWRYSDENFSQKFYMNWWNIEILRKSFLRTFYICEF